jgi:hypothetical protein
VEGTGEAGLGDVGVELGPRVQGPEAVDVAAGKVEVRGEEGDAFLSGSVRGTGGLPLLLSPQILPVLAAPLGGAVVVCGRSAGALRWA